jgi:hypothetical protein
MAKIPAKTNRRKKALKSGQFLTPPSRRIRATPQEANEFATGDNPSVPLLAGDNPPVPIRTLAGDNPLVPIRKRRI